MRSISSSLIVLIAIMIMGTGCGSQGSLDCVLPYQEARFSQNTIATLSTDTQVLTPSWELIDSTLAQPVDISISGEIVSILDLKGKPKIHTYHFANRSKTNVLFSAIDNTPKQEYIWSLGHHDSSSWYYDIANKAIRTYDNSYDENNQQITVLDEVYLDSDRIVTSVQSSDHGAYYASGFFDSSRVVVYDQRGKFLQSIGLPPYNTDGRSICTSVLQHANQANVLVNRNGSVALLARYFGGLEIYSETGSIFVQISEHKEPVFGLDEARGQQVFVSDPNEPIGFVDASSSDDKIFALYSGNPVSGTRIASGRRLIVFNWNGEILEEFVLDHESISIAYDSEKETLLAVAVGATNSFAVYTGL